MIRVGKRVVAALLPLILWAGPLASTAVAGPCQEDCGKPTSPLAINIYGHTTSSDLSPATAGALPRMEALKTVVDEHGVNFMATICAICKAQFTKVMPYYGFDMNMIGGVHQLVSKAIRLDK